MPREATGELRRLADGFAARITLKGRQRRDFLLATCGTEAEAQDRTTALAKMAARLRRAGHVDKIVRLIEKGAKARAGRPFDTVVAAVDVLCSGNAEVASDVPKFGVFAKEWTTGALARKFPDHVRVKRSSGRDEELLRLYILPHVGDIPLDEFELTDGELVMASLPDICAHTKAPLSAGTRRHIAQVISRLMNLAVYPGKWRTSSPIPRGWLPKVGDSKAKECLYPDEDRALLTCTDIPLLRRFAYGFLDREGTRTDELARFTWLDIDLVHNRADLDENKTDNPRAWDMRRDSLLAMKIWRKYFRPNAKPTDLVFTDDDGVAINVDHLADQLRKDLKRAKVDRPKLFMRSKTRLRMRAHDLRATFITVSLANGRTWEWCQQRTGHGDAMKDTYRRKAATWVAQQQGDLAPLHLAIPEFAIRAQAIAPRLPHGAASRAREAVRRYRKVHGEGLEPSCLAAAEPKSAAYAISPPVREP